MAQRSVVLWAALVAVALTLPSLRAGLCADDYFHRAKLVGSRAFGELMGSPLDLFRFFNGDHERARRMMDLGFLPWWTYTGLKGAFWRPLTGLTHWVDYHLWPRDPLLMHVQSVLWYGALVAAAAAVYRRLHGATWLAGLAALLYAIDDAHGMPVGFLANRNALVAGTFGFLALYAHDRWRTSGWRAGAGLAPLLLAASLLAGEAGLATCGYLAAHALFLERGRRVSRALVLLPYAALVVAWRIVWNHLDCGVVDIGLYVDPLAEPGRYLAAVVRHAPVLLLGQWLVPPPEVAIFLGPTFSRLHWGAAAAFVVLLAILLLPLLRRDRVARFWALGMVLAVLPICATFPADRLLFFVGLGAMGLLAQFLQGVFGRADWPPAGVPWRRTARVAGGVFIALHCVVAPLALPIRAAFPDGGAMADRFGIQVAFDPSIEQQDLVLVNPPSVMHVAYFLAEREERGLPAPRRVRALASGRQAVAVSRPDERTLVVRPARGFISWKFEELLRDERNPMVVGERVELTGLTIEVTALTEDGRPGEAVFRFAVPLEDTSLHWLCWGPEGFVSFALPAVGSDVVLGRD